MYTSSNRRSLGSVLAAFIFLFSVTTVSAFEGDASNGKKLFKSNCASCHKLDKKLVGPALTGVTDKYSEEWLLAWIRNNAELRASGDADAIAIFEEYNGSVMSAFPALRGDQNAQIRGGYLSGDIDRSHQSFRTANDPKTLFDLIYCHTAFPNNVAEVQSWIFTIT